MLQCIYLYSVPNNLVSLTGMMGCFLDILVSWKANFWENLLSKLKKKKRAMCFFVFYFHNEVFLLSHSPS